MHALCDQCVNTGPQGNVVVGESELASFWTFHAASYPTAEVINSIPARLVTYRLLSIYQLSLYSRLGKRWH